MLPTTATAPRRLSRLEKSQQSQLQVRDGRGRRLLQLFYVAIGSTMLVLMWTQTALWFGDQGLTTESQQRQQQQPVASSRCAAMAAAYHQCPSNDVFPTSMAVGQLSQGKGVTCDFCIATDTEYLPDADLVACMEEAKPVAWTEDAIHYQEYVRKLQHPSDCNEPPSEDFLKPDWRPSVDKNGKWMRKSGTGEKNDYSAPKWHLLNWLNHGWAYNLFVFSWNAANHWSSGVPVITGNSKYRFTDWECGRGYSCELSPLSSCRLEDINPSQVLVYGIGTSPKMAMSLDQLCVPNGKYLMRYGRCDCAYGYVPATDVRYSYCQPYSAIDLKVERKRSHVLFYENNKGIALKGDEVWFANNAPGEENPHSTYNPVHFESGEFRKKHGFLWEHAQSLYYLMRESRMKNHNDRVREKLGLTAPGSRCIGVHVRHGDACHDKYQNHRVCLPLARFVDGIRKLTSRYGKYDKVFLATDDPQVIADTKQYADEFDFVFQPQDRNFYETGDSAGVDVREDFNAPKRVNEIASDIWALAHCDAFVGSFASSVAWVAYEYMVAQKGFYAPFVSVDMPYAHRKNVGRFLDEGPNQ